MSELNRKKKLRQEQVEVLVIGAGPSGTLSSALLNQHGIEVLVVEKQQFPRFSIGESLLPQLMVFLEKAGLLDAVKEGMYQLKDGAAFRRRGEYSTFNFSEKYTPGPSSTFQVKRADFDKRLADEVEARGVPIRYQQEVTSFESSENHCLVTIRDEHGDSYLIKADFVLDASGYGRVLSRLLKLEYPSDFPPRSSLFCHIRDNITSADYDRNKILVSVHPTNSSVWYWLIPFSDGTCSLGVVGSPEFLEALPSENRDKLWTCVQAEPDLARLLAEAEIINKVLSVSGYAANVKKLYGDNFALLGNAGEFLDPVFSSGVTIAFKSAELASNLLIRTRQGEQIDWEKEYSVPLMKGVNTFRAFVKAWYEGSLQDIIFYPDASSDIREKLCAILAGYAWDESNPYVSKAERRLGVLAEICRNKMKP